MGERRGGERGEGKGGGGGGAEVEDGVCRLASVMVSECPPAAIGGCLLPAPPPSLLPAPPPSFFLLAGFFLGSGSYPRERVRAGG